tara:strand:- start:604 stop:816 length:213 start_codon:yes stop_codon:yes gene_type:complete
MTFYDFIEWCGSSRRVTIESVMNSDDSEILITFVAVNKRMITWDKRVTTVSYSLIEALERIKSECVEAGF